jgi:hypothetical protein
MTVGMVPMALSLEKGSQMESPLGRAVIGGLILSTVCTLLIVPSIFALVIGTSKHRSPSLSPEHHESHHYDPEYIQTEAPEAPAPAPIPGSPSPTDPRPEVQT